MSYLKDFLKHITARDYPAFLNLWEEYCAGDELDGEEVLTIFKHAKNASFSELFGKDIQLILPLLEQVQDEKLSREIFKLIIDIDTTKNKEMGKKVLTYLKDHYKDDEHFTEKMRLIGMRTPTHYQGAISKYELLSHIKAGKFVFHTAGWGVGMVIEHSLIREQLSLEFDYVAGKKYLSFETAFNTLIPLPDDHFLSERFGDPDALEAKAKKKPLEVIHMLLRDLGPKTASEIKDELCELVIPEGDWVKWWQNARSKIKKDTLIETPANLRSPFVLRRSEVTHEEKLQKELKSKPDASTLIQMLYSFMKDFPETLKNADFKKELSDKIEEMLAYPEVSTPQKLQLFFFLQDLKGAKVDEQVDSIIKEISSAEEALSLLEGISILSFKKRVLIEARRLQSDWVSTFLNLILKLDQSTLRDYVLNELLSKDGDVEKVTEKVEELCSHPTKYPDVLVWYFQKIIGQKKFPHSNSKGRVSFFEAFLILLSHLEYDVSQRDLVKKMQNLLSGSRFSIVRKIMKEASIEDVKEFLLLSTKCHSIPDHDIKILKSLAEVAHPALSKKKSKISEEDETIIWTTEKGLLKVKQRVEQIATVETVENAKEIETARAHGDLRENAEFKAALEKRDRLQSELKLLSDQIHNARIFTASDVPTKHAGIGSVITCTNKDKKEVKYTLLGPWDADPDKNILAFHSKLAQTIKGKSVGDSFEFQKDTFTITGIASYL